MMLPDEMLAVLYGFCLLLLLLALAMSRASRRMGQMEGFNLAKDPDKVTVGICRHAAWLEKEFPRIVDQMRFRKELYDRWIEWAKEHEDPE